MLGGHSPNSLPNVDTAYADAAKTVSRISFVGWNRTNYVVVARSSSLWFRNQPSNDALTRDLLELYASVPLD